MVNDHYWLKHESVIDTIEYKGRTLFNKYEKVNNFLDQSVINRHFQKEITVAHSLINKTEKVENIVIDYNGRDPQRFYHKARLLLLEEGYMNFTAFETKTHGHLHLYIHIGNTALHKAIEVGKILSEKLAAKQPKQWRMFPTEDLPSEYNILNIPYEVYAKERGVS